MWIAGPHGSSAPKFAGTVIFNTLLKVVLKPFTSAKCWLVMKYYIIYVSVMQFIMLLDFFSLKEKNHKEFGIVDGKASTYFTLVGGHFKLKTLILSSRV